MYTFLFNKNSFSSFIQLIVSLSAFLFSSFLYLSLLSSYIFPHVCFPLLAVFSPLFNYLHFSYHHTYCTYSSLLGNSTSHILKQHSSATLSSSSAKLFLSSQRHLFMHSSAIGILLLKTPPYFHVIFETRTVFLCITGQVP